MVLRGLGPHKCEGAGFDVGAGAGDELVKEFSQCLFAALPAGAQSMVLLMRVLVGCRLLAVGRGVVRHG